MRFIYSTVLCLLIFSATNIRGQQSVSFPSEKLQEITRQYTGSTMNWPVVVGLASHDAVNNTFLLSASDVLQLKNLMPVVLDFEDQQTKLSQFISDGAVIFAKEELITANHLIEKYLQAVKQGSIEQMVQTAEQAGPAVEQVGAALAKNRHASVRAQLVKKNGNVDKRKGLLAEWKEAFVHDLLEEADGIKTYTNSFAALAFADGSRVQINSETEAVIRKSRLDKLSESSDTEITLVEGGLLARLSEAGRSKGRYILNSGAASAHLRTNNLLAENENGDKVRLSNYDGIAEVSANDITINIGKNEGTIVEGSNAPLPSIKLIPAPDFLSDSPDTVIYDTEFVLPFSGKEGADTYFVQVSSSYNFDAGLHTLTTPREMVRLQDLKLGITYVRIQSVDKYGLKGPYSETFRIIRNIDTQPPPIFGKHFDHTIVFTTSARFRLNGITEPDAVLTVNEAPVTVSKSGSFEAEIDADRTDQLIDVTAADQSGNTEKKQVRLVRLTPETLTPVAVNGRTVTETIDSSCGQCTITGAAFPGMEVSLTNNGITKKVRTDSGGNWGAVLELAKGSLELVFKAVNFEDVTLSEVLTIH